jgi:hypothetical protein
MFAFIGLVAGVMAVSVAHAAPTTCSGEASYPTQVVSGACSAGRCSGILPSVSIASSGRCNDGVTFEASSRSAEGSLVGQCNGHEFVAIGSAEVLEFHGGCSNGGVFKGGARVRPQWISGTCDENGAFNATVTSWKVTVEGSCGTAGAGPSGH